MKAYKRAYLRLWLGYTNFSGETSRAEFWRAMAVNVGLGLLLALLAWVLPIQLFNFLSWAYGVIMLLPTITLIARRLHAAGRGTIWLFLLLVPVAGQVAVLAMCCMKDKGYVE